MNAYAILSRQRIKMLRPEDVKEHLIGTGWMVDPTPLPNGVILCHPVAAEAEVFLPERTDSSDYPILMGQLLDVVAIVQQRPVLEVFNTFTTPPGDLIRVRVSSQGTAGGLLPLDEGVRFLQGTRDALAAAACTVVSNRSYYSSYPKKVKSFLKSCRLGQTERGSFVATILSPVPAAMTPRDWQAPDGFDFRHQPFPRLATIRLMESLQQLTDAFRAREPQPFLKGSQTSISVNLCDALVEMQPSEENARVEIGIDWATTRPFVPKTLPSKVSFSQREFERISEVGQLLRDRAARRARVEGNIVSLHADTSSLFRDFDGNVEMVAVIDSRVSHIHLSLERDDYLRAVDAHRNGLKVSVEGELQQRPKGNRFVMLEPHDFQIVQAATTNRK